MIKIEIILGVISLQLLLLSLQERKKKLEQRKRKQCVNDDNERKLKSFKLN